MRINEVFGPRRTRKKTYSQVHSEPDNVLDEKSSSKKQAKTMTAACKNADFRKKVDIPKKVACEFHKKDKGAFHEGMFNFETGEEVYTPMGHGLILGMRNKKNRVGDPSMMQARVKHDDYSDHDGDTFWVDVGHLSKIPLTNKNR